MDPHPIRHRLELVASAVLFSTGGAAIKLAELTGWQVAGARSAIAALMLAAVLPGARRGWSWRMAPVAGAYAATLILFVLANRLTTAANAIFLQSSAPLYVLLLGPLLLHESIRRENVVYMLAVAAGIVLFFAGSESATATAANPRLGNILAAGSGLTYALTLAGLRWLSRSGTRDAGIATVAIGNLVACLCALPMALPVRGGTAGSLAVVLYLGTVQVGLAYILLTRGIRHVPAFEATTLLITEPALSPFWTWLVHGEVPAAWSLAGGVLILGATLIHTLRPAQRH